MSLTTEPVPPPVGEDALSAAARERLSQSPHPLKLAEVVKGLPRPRTVKPAEFKAGVLQLLDSEFRLGRAFRYESGPKGEVRFWSRDEKQALREAALAAASQPKTLSALKTAVGKAVKGTDGRFAEDVGRGLIGEDRLFEHPPKTRAGGPLFATYAPPPPLPRLEQPKFKKKVDVIAKSAAKLLAEAGTAVDDLLAALRARLAAAAAPAASAIPAAPGDPVATSSQLDQRILDAVSNAGPGGVIALSDLRRRMPEEYREREFDAAVLRLDDEGKLRVYQDSDPLRYSPEERAAFVSDDKGHLFTSVSKRE